MRLRAVLPLLAAAVASLGVGAAPAAANFQPMPPGWSPANPTAGWNCGWAGSCVKYAGFVGAAGSSQYSSQSLCKTSVYDQGVKEGKDVVRGHNCTNYVAYRLQKNGAARFITDCHQGADARSWDERARDPRCKDEVPVDATPAPGAVIQWDENAGGYTASGHVAYIDAVFGDSILISETAYSKCQARLRVLSISALRKQGLGDGRIEILHPKDLPNPGEGAAGQHASSNVLASNMALSVWRAAADFTKDGKADLLYQDKGSTNIYLLTSTGTGVKHSTWVTGVGLAAWREVGDVNGDGYADLVYQDKGASQIRVIYGGPGGRAAGSGVLVSGMGMSAWRALADFTKDGKADLLYQDPGSTKLHLLTSVSTYSQWFANHGGAAWREVGDVSGDGYADLVYQEAGTKTIRVIYGASGGRSGSSGVLVSGVAMSAWRALADFTRDGKADLLYQNDGSKKLDLLKSTGTAFTHGTWVDGLAPAAWREAADVNGDRIADLVYQDPGSTEIRVIFGG